MSRLRETLDELHTAEEKPTTFETTANKHQVHCGVCDELYYVDTSTYEKVRKALEFDPTDNPFRCTACEEEYEEESLS